MRMLAWWLLYAGGVQKLERMTRVAACTLLSAAGQARVCCHQAAACNMLHTPRRSAHLLHARMVFAASPELPSAGARFGLVGEWRLQKVVRRWLCTGGRCKHVYFAAAECRQRRMRLPDHGQQAGYAALSWTHSQASCSRSWQKGESPGAEESPALTHRSPLRAMHTHMPRVRHDQQAPFRHGYWRELNPKAGSLACCAHHCMLCRDIAR